MKDTAVQWEYAGSGNYVLDGDGFYISYSPNTSMLGPFSGDGGGDETALCKDGTFLVLNGDFRDDYENLMNDYDKCLEFYESKKEEFGSSWTDD